MLRILTFSTLFPNVNMPGHGIFVAARLQQLLNKYGHSLDIKVVAPIPWFPACIKGVDHRWKRFVGVPFEDTCKGMVVSHPRYPVIPKVGMSLAPLLLALASFRALKREQRRGYDFDLIDAHYYYPDGVAAVMLGKYFKKPVVITARGSDINLLAQYAVPRLLIKWAIKNATHSITVSSALRDKIVKLSAENVPVITLRNGVDLSAFKPPEDRDALRRAVGFAGIHIISVGNLVELKGHDLVIKAMESQPGVHLTIIGEGEQRSELELLTATLNLGDRVTFTGRVDQKTLGNYYGAADLLVLASSREGWANVLLESMACGTRVLATKVGGNSEVVQSDVAGKLVERSVDDISRAISDFKLTIPDRTETRRYAELFSWEPVSDSLFRIFSQISSDKP